MVSVCVLVPCRFYVLFRLPGLKFLDSTNVKEEELVEAKRVGPFMQVVKFTEDEVSEGSRLQSFYILWKITTLKDNIVHILSICNLLIVLFSHICFKNEVSKGRLMIILFPGLRFGLYLYRNRYKKLFEWNRISRFWFSLWTLVLHDGH